MPIDPRMVAWDKEQSSGIDPRMIKWENEESKPTPAKDWNSYIKEAEGNLSDNAAGFGLGLINGASRIGNTLINASSYMPRKIGDMALGKESPMSEWNRVREQGLNQWRDEHQNDPMFGAGTIASEIAGTAGVGGVLGGAAKAVPMLAKYAPVVESGGFTLGNAATGSKVANAGIRALGGATQSGSQAFLVDPENSATAAAIGAVMPSAIKVAAIPGKYVLNKIENSALAEQARQAANAVRDETLLQSKQAGYNIPRSLYDPSFLSNRLESIAGKAATKQQAALNNQNTTNNLAKEYLGLPKDAPLDTATMEYLRDFHAQAYRDAAALPAITNPFSGVGVSSVTSKSGAMLVDQIKEARDVSRAAWRSFNSGLAQSPTKALKEAKKADRLVSSLENELEQLANQHGKTDIVQNLRNARVNIAKVHTIENALNDATGDVSARTIMAQGKRLKLTDQAKTISDFAKAFPQVAQNGPNIPASGVSKVEAMAAALLAGGGGAAFGAPGITAAGLAAIPHMVRPLAINGGMPKYGGIAVNSYNALSEGAKRLNQFMPGLLDVNAIGKVAPLAILSSQIAPQ